MCFSIPIKINKISGKFATAEGGKKIRLENGLKIRSGDYIRISGNLMVDTIQKNQALKIRRLIKRLNNYD